MLPAIARPPGVEGTLASVGLALAVVATTVVVEANGVGGDVGALPAPVLLPPPQATKISALLHAHT